MRHKKVKKENDGHKWIIEVDEREREIEREGERERERERKRDRERDRERKGGGVILKQ